MEKQNTTEEQKVARKEHSRHDAEQRIYEQQIYSLQRNLLVIRETYNVIYGKKYGMKNFYEAVGCTADDFSNILNKKQISQRLHKIISENLHSYGVENSSLRLINALEFELSDDMTDTLDVYFDEYADKTDKEWALRALRAFIAKAYCEEDKYIAGLFLICYNIVSRSTDFVENDLDKAYEVLSELDDIDFSNENIKSRQFAKYVNKLAKEVTSIEEIFPEFYAVAQQMKEDKSAQSIMNEISNNLKSLNNMVLTESDAKSDSCINMLKEISETMKNIYSKME